MKILLYIIFFSFLCVFLGYKLYAQNRIITFKIDAPQLQTSKNIWLYLPIEYNNSQKKYPVIYMHDGQNLFDTKTAFSKSWLIEKKLDSIKANVIVVGIEHGGEKRIAELTPFVNEKYNSGKASAYQDFICNTLKPYIDTNYRTQTTAKHTYLMGSSLGGLHAFYFGFTQPDIFGKVGVFSPAFWINRKEIIKAIYDGKLVTNKYYFVCGDNEGDPDMIKDFNTVIALLKNKKKIKKNNLTHKIVEGGKHNEEFWGNEFLKVYLWLTNNE